MRLLCLVGAALVGAACGEDFNAGSTGSGGASTGSTASATTSASATGGDGGVSASSASASSASASSASSTSASTGSCSMGGAGPSIADLPGLVLWLRADLGPNVVNGHVVSWADQGQWQNDAVLPPSGACVDANNCAPELEAQSINCLPAVRFRPEQPYQLVIPNVDFLQWGTGDFILEVVAKFENQPAGAGDHGAGTLYFKGSLSAQYGPGLFANNPAVGEAGVTGFLDAAASASAANAYNDDVPRVYGMRRLNDVLELRVNGAVVGQALAQVDLGQSDPVRIGSLYGGDGYRLDGAIAEIVATKFNGDDPVVAAIESYLQGKYGL